MSRMLSLLPLSTALAVGLCVSGCTSLMTAQAIQKFADGVASGDMRTLKSASSENFDEKALRLSESLDDLKILNLPTGKVSVAKIEAVSESEKHVTVEVGERKKEVLYKLTRAPGGRKWLVDDVYLKQRKPGDDQEVTKSVTETMDLLLTVREFLDRWQTGGREEVLEVATPELAELLSDLSPTHLQQLTTQIVGTSQRGSHRPEARIEETRAVVMLPRVSGTLLIELTLSADHWRVNDVAVQSRKEDEQVRSTRRLAYVLRTAKRFLEAYEKTSLADLEPVCSGPFYRNSLAVADLSSVTIPSQQLLASPYEVQVHDGQADLLIEAPEATFVLTLSEREPGSIKQKIGSYEVSEVTIYENEGTQVKRVSALFTAQAMLEIFHEALVSRDLARLKQASTADFNAQVWNGLDEELFGSLPLQEFEPDTPNVVATIFQGAVTEITVTQGTRAVTYVLRESNGRMAIDDVLLPVVNRPNSLKQNLQALIPVYGLARACFHGDVPGAAYVSSPELTRLVWAPLETIPDLDVDLVRHLTLPVSSLSMTDDRADLMLGSGETATRLTLSRTDDRFVVDEAVFISGDPQTPRINLKTAGRLNLAAGAVDLPLR